MQRSLLALMVVLTVLTALYGCGEAGKTVERVEKQHGIDKQSDEQEPTAAELALELPASEAPASEPPNLPEYNKEMIEMACEDWDSKVMGPPPAFCHPVGSPAFCHSASSPAFCQ